MKLRDVLEEGGVDKKFWITPAGESVSVKNHVDYLEKIDNESFNKDFPKLYMKYNKALLAGYIRMSINDHNGEINAQFSKAAGQRAKKVLASLIKKYDNAMVDLTKFNSKGTVSGYDSGRVNFRDYMKRFGQ